MHDIWQRIDDWLETYAPGIHNSLRAGADEVEITAFEAAIGMQLPQAVRDAYLIHNGQHNSHYTLLDSSWHLLSLKQALKEWQLNNQLLADGHFFDNSVPYPHVGVQAVWWSPYWIPVAANGAGDLVCVDLAPDEGGQVGQVIAHWHDSNTHHVIAPDIKTWLRRFADDLENGRYMVLAQGLVRDTEI